jgi:hypothetical protein
MDQLLWELCTAGMVGTEIRKTLNGEFGIGLTLAAYFDRPPARALERKADMKNTPNGAKAVKAPKRRRFVADLIEGKSMRKSALEAGYTQSMADNAGQKILPGAREEFQEELARRVPHDKLVQRIVEALNAKETKPAVFEEEYSDRRATWSSIPSGAAIPTWRSNFAAT